MHKQPIIDVNSADVERVVRRDFPEEQFANAMEMLNEYGTERWHRDQPRVWLAVLKLANCSVEALRRYVDAAKADYRDVFVPGQNIRHTQERYLVFASDHLPGSSDGSLTMIGRNTRRGCESESDDSLPSDLQDCSSIGVTSRLHSSAFPEGI